ncbi:DUF4139 domain-containing protein [Polyangium sorediatum]|uniref:DUF4139 domain-containing protein n=1 Tax=Polyangium sorediatum TaxID=889274 RepID=A0ABT6P4K9_9BACT|nr:DUF4139 domain-containing protein [Polyangium sorediatum]MDI1435488.1 DUF4139 domain-containing protein [Polyangium sorediatum]
MRTSRIGAAWALGLITTSFVTGSASAEELALRRVMLSTGGVGYFEHEAQVSGDAELTFDVRLDQVSDVLKSLLAMDPQGRLGQASLPGRAPLSEIFRDLPFSQEDLSSTASLLRALRGQMLRVSAHATTMEGRLVAVTEEKVSLGEGQGTIVRNRLSLLTPTGMRQVVLEEADAIEIVDTRLRAQVEQALAAIAAYAAADQRTITIDVHGQGERTVRVGYVVAAPLWKATYRLVVPKTSGEAKLEGWALLENMSGQDWKRVELSVASGNPVTLRQAVYDSYFVNRPEVPVEVLGRRLPPVDVGAVPEAEVAEEADGAGGGGRVMRRGFMAAPSAADALMFSAQPAAPEPSPIAEPSEGATQVVFHFPDPVDLPRGQSLLVPIVNESLPVERVSWYRYDVDARNPLASVRLTNDTETGLPPGILSIYENTQANEPMSFVGDARLGALPAGEDRFVSYAVDLDMRVNREEKSAQVVTGAKIARGVLEVHRAERRTTMYKIKGAADEARVLVVEHPLLQGFTLAAPKEGVIGTTDTHVRIRREVAAGQTVDLEVVLERPIEQSIVIGSITAQELGVLLASTEISAEVRAALEHVAALQQTLASREQALALLRSERQTLVSDQDRLRRNLASSPQGSDLHTRYLAALASTEDRIGELDRAIETADAAVRVAREELADYIANLSI